MVLLLFILRLCLYSPGWSVNQCIDQADFTQGSQGHLCLCQTQYDVEAGFTLAGIIAVNLHTWLLTSYIRPATGETHGYLPVLCSSNQIKSQA